MNTSHFDTRDLTWCQDTCPVRGCIASLGKAPSQWGEMDYCPAHGIRLHHNSQTFVYYHGSDPDSKIAAALRNILFERDYFERHILGRAEKAESHRICHETSEDALTWNVFSKLARERRLRDFLHELTGREFSDEPELYLWGLRISLDDPSEARQFPELTKAREHFERGIANFKTEPDIMLHVPGRLLLLVEAKFTSGNTVATESGDKPSEKPKSRAGILQRYPSTGLRTEAPAIASPFYSQLYRNLVFAIHMAEQWGTGVEWAVVNLVSHRQCLNRQKEVPYQDPTLPIHSWLPENLHGRFQRYTWEQLYDRHVRDVPQLEDLAAYMQYKSASCRQAFTIPL